jgi:hypothetical protein
METNNNTDKPTGDKSGSDKRLKDGMNLFDDKLPPPRHKTSNDLNISKEELKEDFHDTDDTPEDDSLHEK